MFLGKENMQTSFNVKCTCMEQFGRKNGVRLKITELQWFVQLCYGCYSGLHSSITERDCDSAVN